MKIIGITGPSGSGKSILGNFLANRGIPVINADELYHSLLIPPSRCLDKIRESFGDEVFNSDGTLNRPALSHVVFADKSKLELLNSSVLSIVIEEAEKLIAEFARSGKKIVAMDAPTLIESGFDKKCDLVISVISDPSTRAKRIAERDSISDSAAAERIGAQQNDDFYKKHSDVVIINDEDLASFLEQADKIYAEITAESDDTEAIR